MFKKLEGESAMLVSGGVFKVADLYEHDGKLFAAAAGGYVRIYASGATSKDKLNIKLLAFEGKLYVDRFQRLCTAPGEGRKTLGVDVADQLMLPKD